jgi:hypothetical protein
MSEVELRLSQLREAAERFKRSGLRIDSSVQGIRAVLDQLVLLGFDELLSAKMAFLFSQQQTSLDKWAEQLTRFSSILSEASDDLERALIDTSDFGGTSDSTSVFYSGAASEGFLSLLPLLESTESPQSPSSPALTDYISGTNRPVYDQLEQQQETLEANQVQLDGLVQTRQETLQDLVALKNRLISFDADTDLSAVPRVQMLEAEIVRLDQEILSVKENIGSLQGSINELTVRLDRVTPGAGADLRLVAGLEGSSTAEWVKSHTYGCVNHVVNRMPIPGGISRHAYLWDQAAEQLPQYGITSGNVPLTGSVLVLEPSHSYADDVFGHILYVEKVENGVVWVTDNLHPDAPVQLTEITSEISGPDITYLYFPWHTQA